MLFDHKKDLFWTAKQTDVSYRLPFFESQKQIFQSHRNRDFYFNACKTCVAASVEKRSS